MFTRAYLYRIHVWHTCTRYMSQLCLHVRTGIAYMYAVPGMQYMSPVFIYLFIYLKSTTIGPEGHLYCRRYTKHSMFTRHTCVHTQYRYAIHVALMFTRACVRYTYAIAVRTCKHCIMGQVRAYISKHLSAIWHVHTCRFLALQSAHKMSTAAHTSYINLHVSIMLLNRVKFASSRWPMV